MDSKAQLRDELTEPLGQAPTPARAPRAAASAWRWGLGGAALAALALGGYLAKFGPRGDGEPFAVASVEVAAPAKTPDAAVAPAPGADGTSTALPASATGKEIEAASGVKVVRARNGLPPGGLVIQVPDAIGVRLTPAPDKRLVEKDRYGPLPRVAADGARPADVYARPVMTNAKLKPSAPRIAIVVGGLGLSAAGTADAIANLPGAVSLAFAPYGASVADQAAQAREAGHETLLQAPMEPFDLASGNPGPHTLLAGAPPADNLDSMRWLLSRFTGYVGVANYLGAKFTADRPSLSPILSEIASRGLFYFDDGSSPRSLARDVAAGVAAQVVSADVTIDAAASADKIDAALANLESLARRQGTAVGVVAALPGAVERIARWAASLESRGVALLPVSAMVSRAPPVQARQ